MSPEQLKSFLDVVRESRLGSFSVEFPVPGDFGAVVKLSGVFIPDMPTLDSAGDPEPGGWKRDPQDEQDPDPLGLGALDAPFAADPMPEVEPE